MKYEDGAFVRPKYSKENCFAATSSATCPTWTGLGVDTVLHAERPAPNHLSHVEASRGKRNYSKITAEGDK